jgi:hypothetical protein
MSSNTSFAGNQQRAPGAPVQLASNRTDAAIETGEKLPPLLQIEHPSSISCLVDSADAVIKTSETNFTVDLNYRVNRCRYIQLKKIIVPKINNVTINNNQLIIKSALGTTSSFTLQPGLYNTTDFANELTAKINAQFVADAIVDTVTVSFDSATRSFTITSSGGNNFFFDEASTFIIRGKYLHGFVGQPLADVPSVSSHQSGIASMLYCRYFTVASRALTQYSFSSSILSRASQPNDLIGVVDTTGIYEPADYDSSVQFSKVFETLQVDAPKLSVMNSQRSLNAVVDISITDSYGFDLNDALSLGGSYTANQLSCVFLFEISF